MKDRPFYRDHIAASWMSHHFGMRLLMRDDFFDKDVEYDLKRTDVTGWNIYIYRNNKPVGIAPVCPIEPLYIHPDSLSILDPQEGDVITYPHQVLIITAEDEESNAGVYEQRLGIDWLSDGANRTGMKIIQRQGKPFHQPEYE